MTRKTAARRALDLAYVSPVNPTPSGLSDYSEVLLPALAEHARVTLYTDSGTPSGSRLAERFETRTVQSLLFHHPEHDLRLYQLGNSAQHAAAFDVIRYLPGVVTLHEPFLHTAFRAISAQRYLRELHYDLGISGRAVFDRLRAEVDPAHLLAYPLIGRMVDASLGVIVHSQAARRIIASHSAARSSATEVAVIPPLMPLLAGGDPAGYRAEFGLPPESMLYGVLGLIDPLKEPELILYALREALPAAPHAHVLFAGELPAWYTRLPALVSELNLSERVHFLGRVEPLERLHRAIAACDVIVNLRRPTLGETSATALRAMSVGRPVIVRGAGWYSELPDEAVVKIDADAGATELARAMIRLAHSAEQCRDMGIAARRYIASECDVATIARRYVEFLTAVFERVVASV